MFKRVLIYLNEMYPISNMVGTFLLSVVIQLVLYQLDSKEVKIDVLILSGLSLIAFSLLLRVMDEFKDEKDDIINFPHRPLPSGKVLKNDLKFLGSLCVVASLGLNLFSIPALIMSSLVLLYSYLMLEWFFVEEKMRKSLPLAFVTHHPVVFLHFLYLTFSVSLSSIHWEVLPLGLMLTNWEFSRKIRSPQEETAYTTYSKIFGPRPAACFTLITQIIFLSFTILIILKLQNSFLWLGLLTPAILMTVPYMVFILKPHKSFSFKKIAETQILNVVCALLIVVILGTKR